MCRLALAKTGGPLVSIKLVVLCAGEVFLSFTTPKKLNLESIEHTDATEVATRFTESFKFVKGSINLPYLMLISKLMQKVCSNYGAFRVRYDEGPLEICAKSQVYNLSSVAVLRLSSLGMMETSDPE